MDLSPLRGQFSVKNNVRFGFLVNKYVGMGQPEIQKKVVSYVIYFDFGKKSQKIDIFNFWFFYENQNKSHTKPLFF